jgi:hypothetical protein
VTAAPYTAVVDEVHLESPEVQGLHPRRVDHLEYGRHLDQTRMGNGAYE